MLGDVRQFVENCPVCQMEKSDHQLAKGKLTSTQIPEEKWKEISIDFITDLPMSTGNKDTVLTIVDKATRMVHLVPCRKNITAVATAQLLWQNVVKLHGVPKGYLFGSRATVHCEQLAGAVAPHGDEIEIFFSLPPPDPGSGRANERSGESDTSVPDSQYE